MPRPAARITDLHICPASNGTQPHVGGPAVSGHPTVLIGGLAAARITDQCTCAGPRDVIVSGSATVFIGGLPAARQMDQTGHGGVIVSGASNLLIGG